MAKERSSSAARGRARGAWLAVGVVAAVAGVALLFLLRSGEGSSGAAVGASDAAAAARGGEELLELANDLAGERTNGEGALLVDGTAGLPIRLGVRLRGPGWLEGRVLDRSSGAGVEGARVELLATAPSGRDFLRRVYRMAKFAPGWVERLEPVATVASGPGGAFRFAGVRNGTYFVEARGAWHVPDGAVLARVDSDGAGGPIDVFTRGGGRVLGVVQRSDGSTVAGASVMLYQGHTAFIAAARTGDFRMMQTTTDGDGAFAFAGVPPGDGYDVTVIKSSMAISHALGLSVVAGQDTSVRVDVRAGATVRGQVLASVDDGSGDGSLKPVAGAHVGALPRGLRDTTFAHEVLQATHEVTDDEGRYVMRNVPPGDVDVAAFKSGYVPAKGTPVRAVGGSTLEADPVVLEGGHTVTLRFRDHAGEPVAGVNTSWYVTDFDSLQFEPSFTPLMLQAVEGFEYPLSDEDGVVVAGPFPGDPPHTIFCWRPGYEFRMVEWRPGDGEEIEVVLESGGSVEGIVMDVERAEPITRFLIRTARHLDWKEEEPSVLDPFSGGRWVEDENGRFRIERLAGWDAPVTFSAPGYLAEKVKLSVTPGETTRGVIVKMRRGGTVQGRVVDAEKKPIGGAQVAAFNEEGESVAGRMRNPRGDYSSPKDVLGQEIAMGSMEVFSSLGVLGSGFVLSQPDGSFELTSLPEGRILIHASHRDYAEGTSALLDIVPGEPLKDVEIVLTEGGGIYGDVRDRFGRPVPGAMVMAISTEMMTLEDPSPRWVRQDGTDESGSYRLEHMEQGSYFLSCVRADADLTIASFLGTLNFDLVSVPGDEMLRYDITDSSASAVRVFGTVRADGEPVRSGGLFALGFESESVLGVDVKIAEVHRDGSYEFAGLAPGSYQLTYQGEGPEVRLEVEVPDMPEVRMDLDLPTGGLGGHVLDAVTGAAIEGAEVVLERKDAFQAAGLIGSMIQREGSVARDWSEEDGAFAFRRLQAGSYVLKVGPPRWGAASGRYAPSEPIDVDVTEGVVEQGLEVKLTPSLELKGVVIAASGDPIKGARVYGFAHEGRDVRPARARSEEDGAFTLRSLAPGKYDVTASADGYADAEAQVVEVSAQDAPAVTITLYRGVDVQVVVRDSAGLPVQGATGRLVSLVGTGMAATASLDRAIEGIFTGEGVSGSDGVLKLGRYAPGRYRLEVGRGTLRATREPVVLSEGAPLELDVELE